MRTKELEIVEIGVEVGVGLGSVIKDYILRNVVLHGRVV